MIAAGRFSYLMDIAIAARRAKLSPGSAVLAALAARDWTASDDEIAEVLIASNWGNLLDL